MATLASKKILIVGGTSGIGFSTAEASLASKAEHVVVASSSQAKVDKAVEKLQKVAAQHGGKVSGAVVDARDDKSVQQLVESVGEVDHLIWTSGDSGVLGVTFPDYEPSVAKGVFDVRFWGAVSAAKYAKIKKGGSIILTLGATNIKPRKNSSILAGLAGAVDALTRGLAVDLAPVRVNAVSPGSVLTELWDSFPEEKRTALAALVAERTLVKHVGLPHEIAEAYLFLMKCDFITGKTIEVDGGVALT